MEENFDNSTNVMSQEGGGGSKHNYKLNSVAWLIIVLCALAFAWFIFLNGEGGRVVEAPANTPDERTTGFVYERVGEVVIESEFVPGETRPQRPLLVVLFDGVNESALDSLTTCEMDNIDLDVFKCRSELVPPEGGNAKKGYVWISDGALYDGEDKASILTADGISLNNVKLEVRDGEKAYFER